MESFSDAAGTDGISNATLAGLLTSILELGAWVGVLINGYSADKLGRKLSVVVACFVFAIGVIVQACTRGGHYSYILGGRFVTGLGELFVQKMTFAFLTASITGVGSLSMIVPLYNAELAPPECRGGLVALQQLAITFGIMVAFWLTYGYDLNLMCGSTASHTPSNRTNFIGGTGDSQSSAAWLLPITIQLVPALILAVGINL